MTAFIPANVSAQTLICDGIAAAKAGQALLASELLAQALAIEPRDARAWLWLSGVVPGAAERRYCLEQVLAIDPAHTAARRGLALLPADAVPCRPQLFANAERATLPGVAFSPQPAPRPATGTTTRLAPPADYTVATAVIEPLAVATLATTMVAMPATAAAPAPTPDAAPPEVVELVVRALGSGRSLEETTRLLCQQHGYTWEIARQVVGQIVAHHGLRIARRQAPFLLILGLATLAGGLALLGFGLLRMRGAGQLHYLPYYRDMFMALISGALMVLGAIIGLGQVLGSLRR